MFFSSVNEKRVRNKLIRQDAYKSTFMFFVRFFIGVLILNKNPYAFYLINSSQTASLPMATSAPA